MRECSQNKDGRAAVAVASMPRTAFGRESGGRRTRPRRRGMSADQGKIAPVENVLGVVVQRFFHLKEFGSQH